MKLSRCSNHIRTVWKIVVEDLGEVVESLKC